MKINRDTFPILKKIMEREPLFPTLPSHSQLGLYPQNKIAIDANKHEYEQFYSPIANEIRQRKNITFVTDSVRQAYDANPKVAEKLWLLRNDVPTEMGMLLMGEGQQYLYFIQNDQEKQEVEVVVMLFIKDIFFSFFMGMYKYSEEKKMYTYDLSFDAMANEKNYDLSHPTQTVITFLLFKEYAELETKYIVKGKVPKVKLNNQDYSSQIELPIKIVDSTWFTTLIKSDDFKVSGHFRLQPYGEGFKHRKLIWISEYQKHGIVREAKMLKDQ